MNARLIALMLVLMLAACGGIPLRSLPRLAALQQQLLELDPAQLMLAIEVDARMVPPDAGVPTVRIRIRPARAGAFEPVDQTIAMRPVGMRPALFGLSPAGAGRRWLIYDLPPDGQAALRHVQAEFTRLRDQRRDSGGGTVEIGIAQDGVAADDPALAHTHWESWLQISRQDGFFALWSGSIGDLRRAAGDPGAGLPAQAPRRPAVL